MPTFGRKGKAIERKGRVKSSETWPPEWKPLEQCPQIEIGMISLRTYQIDLEQLDPHGRAKRFLQQLRNSRGYELDSSPPKELYFCHFNLVHPPFWCTDPSLMDKLEFITEKINAEAKKHHERYELMELVRFVESQPFWCDLLTFNVRQVVPEKNGNVVKSVQAMVSYLSGDFKLMEWRFRPGPPESPPEKDLPKSKYYASDSAGDASESSGDES